MRSSDPSLRESELIVRAEMPEIDALRGLAVLLVFLYHGLFWTLPPAALTESAMRLGALFRYGWSGVQLFFVLSGFLITGILIRAKQADHYYRRFYVRRALRILPAFVLLIAALLGARAITWKYALVSAAFGANLSPLLGIAMEYPPLWSLAVEEQFYAIWPAIVRSLSTRRVAITGAVVLIASPAIRAWAFLHGHREGIYFYSWFNLDGLALGSFLAVMARDSRQRFARVTAAISAAAALALAVSIADPDFTSRRTLAGAAFQSTTLYLVYGSFLTTALIVGTSRWRHLVDVPALKWLGRISYGLYLVHVACFGLFDHFAGTIPAAQKPFGLRYVAIRFGIAGGLAIVIAALSRRYYEGFFLSMKDTLLYARDSADERLPTPVS